MSLENTAIEEAEKAGFDLSLMDSNLRLSGRERVLRHAAALKLVLDLAAAGTAFRSQSAPPAKPAG